MGNIVAYDNSVMGIYDNAHTYFTRLEVNSLSKKNNINFIYVDAEAITLVKDKQSSKINTTYKTIEVPVTQQWIKQYHLLGILWTIAIFWFLLVNAVALGLALTFTPVWMSLLTLYIVNFIINVYTTKLETNLYEEYINFLQNDINLLFIAEDNAQTHRDYEAILNDNKESDIKNIADRVVELLLCNLKKEGLQKDFWRNL